MLKRPMRSMAAKLMLAAALSLSSAFMAFAASQDIIILNTNDVHCGVEDNIGYAGLALYEKEMKQQTPYVMLVDAGDSIQGAPIGTLSDGGYLVDIMNEMGIDIDVIRAGNANLFLSPIFREALAGVTGAVIELYDTNGAVGAAKGAGIGAGIYRSAEEAFASLKKVGVVEPDGLKANAYCGAFDLWRERVVCECRTG